MYRTETRKQIRSALDRIIEHGNELPASWNLDPRALAESVDLLSRIVADQLWADGYELKLRERGFLFPAERVPQHP